MKTETADRFVYENALARVARAARAERDWKARYTVPGAGYKEEAILTGRRKSDVLSGRVNSFGAKPATS